MESIVSNREIAEVAQRRLGFDGVAGNALARLCNVGKHVSIS